MTPGRYDITIYRGKTFTRALARKNASNVYVDFQTTYIDAPTVGAGSAIMHIRPAWKVRPEKTKLDPLLTLSTDNSRIAVATTVITLTLPASVTEAITFNSGIYELEMISGDAEPLIDSVLYGTITVKDYIVETP